MYQDYSQYLQWLQMCIQAQEQRILALENALQKMKEDMKKLNDKKAIHVDKIEYKFDQLKVETLEGTLNIGLNPSELAGIEDFAVQNQSLSTPISPKHQMQRSMKIEEAIYRYLETDLPQLVENAQRELTVQPNDEYLSFIKQDIIKQLPGRIEQHLNTHSASSRSFENAPSDDLIIEGLKKEIQNGVMVFFSNLPENLKGMKTE
ncbi:spore germination protein PC [Bacillus sp. OV166]|uniref:spore germination protein GerPC n=1 Tax=unclassified Bacillus (in: firmicutes) TaxID=185979 RepID=UPI000A2AEA62|nr:MULTISPECIES: spore germination protein GerPC [unclassified Bacillus (in: firmicutes)]PGY11279.1 spore gernimation protein [Bacillus sp. AFS031507]SMQ66531.1 spore germination protein PC [Bacillus sp. OV166]